MDALSTESRSTAQRRGIGSSAGSSTTSLAGPRIVVVHGATSARCNRPMAASREITTTGAARCRAARTTRPLRASVGPSSSPPLPCGSSPSRPTHQEHQHTAINLAIEVDQERMPLLLSKPVVVQVRVAVLTMGPRSRPSTSEKSCELSSSSRRTNGLSRSSAGINRTSMPTTRPKTTAGANATPSLNAGSMSLSGRRIDRHQRWPSAAPIGRRQADPVGRPHER